MNKLLLTSMVFVVLFIATNIWATEKSSVLPMKPDVEVITKLIKHDNILRMEVSYEETKDKADYIPKENEELVNAYWTTDMLIHPSTDPSTYVVELIVAVVTYERWMFYASGEKVANCTILLDEGVDDILDKGIRKTVIYDEHKTILETIEEEIPVEQLSGFLQLMLYIMNDLTTGLAK